LVRPLWLAVALAFPVFAEDPVRPLFERDIAPIFSANCWKCHGMENRKAGLDLRTPPLVLRGSDTEPVIVKGSAESSPLFQKISTGAMPPGKLLKLGKEQVELVRRWIDSGAEAARRYDELTKPFPTFSRPKESTRRLTILYLRNSRRRNLGLRPLLTAAR
jgi:hypothetical protein